MSILDYRQPYETPAECVARYRRCMGPHLLCECGESLSTPVEIDTGTCIVCHLAGPPIRVPDGAVASIELPVRHERERDDFDDLDDTCDGDVDDGWSRQAIQAYLVDRQEESGGR